MLLAIRQIFFLNIFLSLLLWLSFLLYLFSNRCVTAFFSYSLLVLKCLCRLFWTQVNEWY